MDSRFDATHETHAWGSLVVAVRGREPGKEFKVAFEVRRFRESELEQAWELDRQAFNVHRSRRDSFFGKAVAERFTGAFEKGRAVAMVNVHPMVHSFGGRFVEAGGVSSVVVAPEHRGQGLASRVMRASLEGIHEGGAALSSLFPANLRLYRQLGWEVAGCFGVRRIQARHLLLLPRPEPGLVRRAEPADVPAIRESYRRVALGVPGMHDGEMRWWELENEFGNYYVYVAQDAEGLVRGALVYEQHANPNGLPKIQVHRVFAETRPAATALWWMLGTSSSQADDVYYPAPPEDPLVLLLPEPRSHGRYDFRWMLRMVDVQQAVAQRGFPLGVEAEVDFSLDDPELAANAGAWRLTVSKGEGRLERIEAARLRLGVGAFSSWYAGWGDATTLLRAGLVEDPGTEGALLDACFAGRVPWMMEEF